MRSVVLGLYSGKSALADGIDQNVWQMVSTRMLKKCMLNALRPSQFVVFIIPTHVSALQGHCLHLLSHILVVSSITIHYIHICYQKSGLGYTPWHIRSKAVTYHKEPETLYNVQCALHKTNCLYHGSFAVPAEASGCDLQR